MNHNKILEVLSQLAVEAAQIKKIRINEKQRFNLFNAIRKERSEVLISRLICYLLDPKESHDCGNIFLMSFLNVLEENPPLGRDDTHQFIEISGDELVSQFLSVQCEVQTKNGRFIDIVIRFTGLTLGIENKIGAIDQENQVRDYVDDLAPWNNGILLYLTPDGRQSDSAGERKYFRISYSSHLTNWIIDCLKNRNHPRAEENLKQFLDIIEDIGGHSMETKETQKLVEILKQEPEIISHFESIKGAFKEIQLLAIHNFFDLLKIHWEAKVDKDVKLDFHLKIDTPDIYKGLFISEWFDADFPKYQGYRLIFEQLNNGFSTTPFWLGFKRWHSDGEPEQATEDMMMKLKAHFQSQGIGLEQKTEAYWPAGWKEIENPFKPENQSALVRKNCPEAEEIIKRVIEEIEKFTESIKQFAHELP